jgi:hypothetical protein
LLAAALLATVLATLVAAATLARVLVLLAGLLTAALLLTGLLLPALLVLVRILRILAHSLSPMGRPPQKITCGRKDCSGTVRRPSIEANGRNTDVNSSALSSRLRAVSLPRGHVHILCTPRARVAILGE